MSDKPDRPGPAGKPDRPRPDRERDTLILTQPEGERLDLDHCGELALQHATASGAPLVHMFCWEEDEACPVRVAGKLTVAGDREAPVAVEMRHRFDDVHRQHFDVAPVQHSLRVDSALEAPIHHALQLSSPLQVRCCNAWETTSDYTLDVRAGERTLLSINLSGSTIATPQPCPPEAPATPVSSPSTKGREG
jgi:hypothetical protein